MLQRYGNNQRRMDGFGIKEPGTFTMYMGENRQKVMEMLCRYVRF